MKRISAALPIGLAAALFASTALADVWVQIEAQPSLTQATERARAYASRLPNVVGFELPGRWHAIAVGPYADEADAALALQNLRLQGLIPADSYTTEGERFGTAFFPVGASLDTLRVATPEEADTTEAVEEAAAVEEVEEIAPEPMAAPDETPQEARRSEALLNREQRMELQTALKFAGFYNSAIDGAFGRGTRGAMAAWQEAKGYEATGVLTSMQRAEVIGARQAVIDSLGLAPVSDTTAGIDITLPLATVDAPQYIPPFVRYEAKDGSGVQVLLISQTGDADTLGGLYEIMQTLEIVPVDGPRSRDGDSFTLTGSNSEITTHIEARLSGGTVKGWGLVWPTGDEQRRSMALEAMKSSFTPRGDEVLPDAYGEGAAQDIDLLAGLAIRRASRTGTGFFVDEAGKVLTDAAVVEECARVTFDDDLAASVSAMSDGMALITPQEAVAPLGTASFDSRLPRLQAEVASAGYAYGGRLGTPTLNFGTLAEHAGLNGETDLLRLDMTALPEEFGSPLMTLSGGVIGMVGNTDTGARALPENVSFAYDVERIAGFLGENGVSVPATEATDELSGTELIELARDMTVLVSCWDD
ncbi:serine protease [Celeribacter sp.]|uniref:serine protease n=1 Tax=Celeribacter sp. TaxID=1890673 RepID=UPI003A8E3183